MGAALRRAYGGSPLERATKAVVLAILATEILQAYRLLLFLITYCTLPA